MLSFTASVLAVVFHTLGFAIGCAIWGGVGYCLGGAFSHAPLTGLLCGVAYQLASYVYLHEQMWESLERAQSRFVAVFSRAAA